MILAAQHMSLNYTILSYLWQRWTERRKTYKNADKLQINVKLKKGVESKVSYKSKVVGKFSFKFMQAVVFFRTRNYIENYIKSVIKE